ncbi:diguanylate cyclase [Desulfosporosinus sp. HMP52]|uniref:MASE3 domain-containing protein n=1 Tax=Desulfosporosinus sp. HMP52 TaxID=1487923 RepID=UPI00051F8D34|nr:MASE3 domain-containing protein [Desulfosporosinus sp. HMP52]KGK92075.1 diguanylate cyclase [Desulfosporosinus sp. HMP52]
MGWTNLIMNKGNGAKAPVVLSSVALVSVLISYLSSHLLQDIWHNDPIFLHSALEGACICVAIFTFLTMWQNYERSSTINRLVGFGFLLVGGFDFLHTYYYPLLNHHPLGFDDISSRYWVLGRLTEGVILLLGTFDRFKGPQKRSLGLVITISLGASISYLVYAYQGWFPVLLTDNGGVTTAKIICEYIIIALFLLNLLLLYPKVKQEEYIIEKYLFVALIIAIPAEQSFASYLSLSSFDYTYGHILKFVYYFFLYKGLFASTVTHPYLYHETILNELPIGIINYDKYEKIRFVNTEAARLIGVTPTELIGLSSLIFEKRFYKNGDKSTIRDVREGAKRFNNVFRTIDKGTDKVELEISGFRFSQGGWLLYFNDAKLAHLFENLQLQTKTILNSMDSMVLVSDANGRVSMCNNSFIHLTGFTEEEVINKRLSKVESLLRLNLSKPSKIKKSHEGIEGCFLSKDGVNRDIVLNLNSVQGIDNSLIGNVVVATDISSARKETERLRQREKLAVLGQMAAGIGHEIRNPMTTVRGFLQLLGERNQYAAQKPIFELMISELDRANSIITEFLMLARTKHTKMKFQNLNDILNHLYPLIEADAFNQNKQIRYIPGAIPSLKLNKNEISQLVMNLVRNGLEAMKAGGSLTIRTNLIDDKVLLVVEDEGCGIPAENLAKVGTPFFTTKDDGTGLGLATSFTIAETHNAQVDIKSSSKGTKFYISFQLPDVLQDQGKMIV